MSQNLLSAAVVIGTLRVDPFPNSPQFPSDSSSADVSS